MLRLRLQVAKRTDARIGIMNEIVGGMKVIKLYGWEETFAEKIAQARKYVYVNEYDFCIFC